MLLFVHDHKFRRVNGRIYTTGGLSNETIQRYTRLDNEVVLFTRIIDEQDKAKQWSLIRENVTVKGDSSLSGNGLEEVIKKADGVIIRLPSFLGNKACELVKRYQKPYLIEMVGCAWDSLWNHGIKGKIIAPYSFLRTRKYVKDAPYVLYVTEKFLQGRYPTNGKSIGCSDVVIEDVNPGIFDRRIEKINKRNRKRIIGTIGAVDVRYKGQEYVIQALSILKKRGYDNLEYQIVGNGDQSFLRSKAETFKVENQVYFLGGLAHEKIFDWLDSIDIYIQPSKTEGLPRALIEAQSRALPCLGSRVGGIPELIGEECVFDVSKKADEIATAISKKIEFLDQEMEKKIASYNYENAKKYNHEVLEKERSAFYKSFYDTLCTTTTVNTGRV